jgi:hypothetical protein
MTDAETQLKSFVDKFDPAHGTIIRAVRKALRTRFPTAIELAYDNYNFTAAEPRRPFSSVPRSTRCSPRQSPPRRHRFRRANEARC